MMVTQRPFRFGAAATNASSREAWIDYVRKVESLGYSTLVTGDHIFFGGSAPIPALMAAADATTILRLATHVLANDFRNPVMLAQEVATLDLLSEGRLELGVGAGWLALDYAAAGIPFDPPVTRVKRLEETVHLLKRLFGDEPVAFTGDYYTIQDMNLQTKPLQRPHPPLFIGGGGKQVLTLAGREANIVGLDLKGAREGGKDMATGSADAVMQKIDWVRQAAGERFAEIEFHMLFNTVTVTDDRRRGAEQTAAWLTSFPPGVVVNLDTSIEGILDSPLFLIGTIEQIAEELRVRRERFGISYVTVGSDDVEAFGPVVERLAGT
jgi:probable F420-dependent oxidoreductase